MSTMETPDVGPDPHLHMMQREAFNPPLYAVTLSSQHPWGVSGKDFDASFVVTSERLLRPADLAAARAAARAEGAEAMREACAKHVERIPEWGGQDYYCDSCKGGAIYPDREDVARDLRALPIPAADALARREDDWMRLLRAAEAMPRATPGPGDCGTSHQFTIEAGIVWELDIAIKAIRARAGGEERQG